jgi:hypothetical protein
MQNSTSKSLTVVNNTLEAEGFALAKEYKSITKGDKARFTKATKADGFDTRLGKLMQKLKAEGGERISSDRLKDCGINGIDKRRRSEALWFVENETACRDFIQASKKGFTSLTALQAAMKPKAAPKPKADADKPTGSEADDKSNIGLDSEADKPAVKVEADDIAVVVLDMMQEHNVTLAQFEAAFDAIKVILQDEDTNKAKAVA